MTFAELIEAIEYQKGSSTTQIAGTTGSYQKVGLLLKPLFPVTKRKLQALDYGAGLGLGTAELQSSLGPNFSVDSYEPAPERSQGPVTFNSSDQLTGPYDVIVCLNVLNVLERPIRTAVVKDILELLGPKGIAFIGARKWSGDVDKVARNVSLAKSHKGFKHLDLVTNEDKSVWIPKRTKKSGIIKVFQKGFDGTELIEYVASVAGKGYDIRRVAGIAGNSILIMKEKKK